MGNYRRNITREFSLIDDGKRKILYRTSQYRDIQEVKVVDFDDKTFTALGSDYFPTNKHISDWLNQNGRYSHQVNYHETREEAKSFIRNKLSIKINKLNSDLVKYQGVLLGFK